MANEAGDIQSIWWSSTLCCFSSLLHTSLPLSQLNHSTPILPPRWPKGLTFATMPPLPKPERKQGRHKHAPALKPQPQTLAPPSSSHHHFIDFHPLLQFPQTERFRRPSKPLPSRAQRFPRQSTNDLVRSQLQNLHPRPLRLRDRRRQNRLEHHSHLHLQCAVCMRAANQHGRQSHPPWRLDVWPQFQEHLQFGNAV